MIFFIANSLMALKKSIPKKKITRVSFNKPDDQNKIEGTRNTGRRSTYLVSGVKNSPNALYIATSPINDRKQKNRLCI
jgi:hypothetical protein